MGFSVPPDESSSHWTNIMLAVAVLLCSPFLLWQCKLQFGSLLHIHHFFRSNLFAVLHLAAIHSYILPKSALLTPVVKRLWSQARHSDQSSHQPRVQVSRCEDLTPGKVSATCKKHLDIHRQTYRRRDGHARLAAGHVRCFSGFFMESKGKRLWLGCGRVSTLTSS